MYMIITEIGCWMIDDIITYVDKQIIIAERGTDKDKVRFLYALRASLDLNKGADVKEYEYDSIRRLLKG